jgi:hypothetical protein
MALHKTIYEGDSLFHTPTLKGGRGDAEAKPDTGNVSTRRSQALRNFFPQLSVWLNNRIHFSRMREVERYLSQATDLVDLEQRIARIERNALWH